MKYLSLAAMLFGIGAVVLTAAQPPDRPRDPPPSDRDGRGGNGPPLLPPMIRGELNLTPEQERQIAELEQEVRAKLAKILTPEQRRQLMEFRPLRPNGVPPEARDRPDGRRPEQRPDQAPRERPDAPPPERARGNPGDPNQALNGLKLTEFQKIKAEELIRTHQEKMRRLLADGRADLLKQMKEVLGEDQYKEFEKSMRSEGGDRPPRGPRDGDEKSGDRPPPRRPADG